MIDPPADASTIVLDAMVSLSGIHPGYPYKEG
jgi:hypothetical protein